MPCERPFYSPTLPDGHEMLNVALGGVNETSRLALVIVRTSTRDDDAPAHTSYAIVRLVREDNAPWKLLMSDDWLALPHYGMAAMHIPNDT